jgi:uncharacterized membrane protein YkoI
MKIKNMTIARSTVLCLGLAAGLLAGCATENEQSEAKLSKADAEKIAMARVPDGTIKESELEKEHGKLQWSFDMATPGGGDEITEVNIDAITGAVISVGKEKGD